MTSGHTQARLPPLDHVGIVVLDLDAAARDFERRWGTRLCEIVDVTLPGALFHDRPVDIMFRCGVIDSGASRVQLTEPLSDSPFSDFLKERKGDGVHHLAYLVDDVDAYLDRLRPTCAELVLDARMPQTGERLVLVDGFAHGPTIELIQRPAGGADG